MSQGYMLPESLRQSLLPPPIQYHDGVLPSDLAKEIAETAPVIPDIVPGMEISEVVRILGEARKPAGKNLPVLLLQPIAA